MDPVNTPLQSPMMAIQPNSACSNEINSWGSDVEVNLDQKFNLDVYMQHSRSVKVSGLLNVFAIQASN